MKYVFALALLVTPIWAQTGRFDVVSIKPSDPFSERQRIGISPGGSFEASGVRLSDLIQQAYNIRPFQLLGASGWMETDRYEIHTKDEKPGPSEAEIAKMSEEQRNAVRDQFLAKLQALLAERFQLKIHRETKEMPIYILTLAKGGPKLQTPPDDKPGGTLSSRRTDDGKREVIGQKLTAAGLARFLSGQIGRTIIDQSGLAGKYDFKLTWAPDMGDTTGPSLFTALQDQLGLKLDSSRGPVEVVVVESAEKPSAN
jgi:bla regulator protein BlaR1